MSEKGYNGSSERRLIVAGCLCLEEIGKGSSSIVYDAIRYFDTPKAHPVAVKLIRLDNAYLIAKEAELKKELTTYHNLNNPFVLPILDSQHSENEYIAIVMPRINGPTVDKTLATGPWHLLHAMSLFRRLTKVLDDLHNQNVIHSDVQTSNVILSEAMNPTVLQLPHIYLLDFGLAKREYGNGKLEANDIRRDVNGLAQLMQTVLWPCDEMEPDVARGLNKQFVDVLREALKLDTSYITIHQFEMELRKAMTHSLDFLKQALRGFQTSGLDSAVIQTLIKTQEFYPKRPSLISRVRVTMEKGLSNIKLPLPHLTKAKIIAAAIVIIVGLVILVAALLGRQAQAQASMIPEHYTGVMFTVRDGKLVLVNRNNNALLHYFMDLPASVSEVSPDGRYMLVERTVMNIQTGHRVYFFENEPIPVAAAFSGDGEILAMHDGTHVNLFDVRSGRRLHILTGITPNQVKTLFTLDGFPQLHAALAESRHQTVMVATR